MGWRIVKRDQIRVDLKKPLGYNQCDFLWDYMSEQKLGETCHFVYENGNVSALLFEQENEAHMFQLLFGELCKSITKSKI